MKIVIECSCGCKHCMHAMRHNKQKESGVILIITILLIAIISALSIYLIHASHMLMRKTQQVIEKEQLQHVARAVEDFGIHLLYWDNWFDALIWHEERMEYDLPRPSLEVGNPLGYDPHNDSKFESWSISHSPDFLKADLGDDYVEQNILYITDMNRYFNINNLHFSNSVDVNNTFKVNVKIFKELMNQVVDENVNKDKLINEIIDWLDHDNDSRSAILLTEDDVYRRAESSYRPPNRPIISIGELNHVLGMTPEIMSQLSKYVVALPVYAKNFSPYKQVFSPYNLINLQKPDLNSPELTKININTCSPELLTAIFAAYNNKAGAVSAIRKQGYFQNVNKSQALNFRTYFSHSAYSGWKLDRDKDEQNKLISEIETSVDLVASEYSQFFLIESFFQKNNGFVFNYEGLVYKNKIQFNFMPVIIQRQYDFLPLSSIH